MADTIPDVAIDKTWKNVADPNNLGVPTPAIFTVQNKSYGNILIAIGPEPSAASTDGFVLRQFEHLDIAGETQVWVRSFSTSVQTGEVHVGEIA